MNNFRESKSAFFERRENYIYARHKGFSRIDLACFKHRFGTGDINQ